MKTLATAMAAMTFMAAAGLARAQDFCIYSKVFVGKETIESTTVFRAGRAYDMLSSPQEITIFDPPNHRFVVLDPQRKVKTEINTEQLDAFCQKMRSEALTTNDPLARFLAAPSFDESFDAASGELTLSNAWMTYQVKTSVPKQGDMARQYAHYVQWQTKLNTALRAGALPPFARLALNSVLEKHGRIPVEVQLTRQNPNSSRKPVTMRSEHRIQPVVLSSDQARIDDVDRHLATFSSLSLQEYQRRELPPVDSAQQPADTKK